MGDMVEIRVLEDHVDESEWSQIPVTAYMPTFLANEQDNIDNVMKRIAQTYSREGIRVRWNFKESPEKGYWVHGQAKP